MPPKRRARKLTTPCLVVPPKKRKAVREIVPEPKERRIPIPEWLKVSIQILLINFHSEGVGLLNSIQSEFEAVYKDTKVDPRDYDFSDWESMLKSPQCKSHFFVYTEKKIPRVKGYPLPRSAGISIRDFKWTIEPGIVKDSPEVDPKLQPGSSNPVRQHPPTILSASRTHCISDEEELKIEPVANPKHTVNVNSTAPKKFRNFVAKSLEMPKTEKPIILEPEPMLIRTANINPTYQCPPDHVTPQNSFGGYVPGNLPKKKRTFEHWNRNLNTITCKPIVQSSQNQNAPEIVTLTPRLLHPPPIILTPSSPTSTSSMGSQSPFVRRTNVSKTWTRYHDSDTYVIDLSDEEYKNELGDDDAISIQETKIHEHLSEILQIDSAKSPDPDRFSPEPPECHFAPVTIPMDLKIPHRSVMDIIDLECTSEDITNFRTLKKNLDIICKKEEVENVDVKPFNHPEAKTFDPIVKSEPTNNVDNSEETVDSCQPINGVLKGDLTKPVEEIGKCSGWKFIPILFVKPVDFCDVATITDLLRGNILRSALLSDDGEPMVNLLNDPRLISGFRANCLKNYSEVRTADLTPKSDELVKHDPEDLHVPDDGGGLLNKDPDPTVQEEKEEAYETASSNGEIEDDEVELPSSKSSDIRSPEPHSSSSRQLSHATKDKEFVFKIGGGIPPDPSDLKSLQFSDLWKETKWKRRFICDKVGADKFFHSSIYGRWKEVWKTCDVSKYRKDLIHELQKYEERQYPSRCEFFLRSSLRMVEIDYLTDNQFSDPKDQHGHRLLNPNDILYYADFAGAPGGVIEFYNSRRRWSSKGFGVTYQNRNYNVHTIPNVIPEFFEPFYGKLNTLNGDGSLFCGETVHIFITRIMEATQGKGVHIVTTIGNVSRVVFEDDNDEKWRYQHLAQIMVALRVLREGGNMAFKMYDIKSAFAAGLLYLLYRSFHQVRIEKLNIFAPSSGERAVICLGRKSSADIHEIQRYLHECHKIMADWYLKKETGSMSKMTIEELIPFSKLEKYTEFMGYLRDSNERLKRAQLEEFQIALKHLKVHGSIFSKGLYRAFVAKTTELWNTGERPKRITRNSRNPVDAFKELKLQPVDMVESVETILNEYNLFTIFSCPNQWRFLPVGNQPRTRGFYLGTCFIFLTDSDKKSLVFVEVFEQVDLDLSCVEGIPHFLNMKFKQWVPVRDQEFRLPSRTLVYAEIIQLFSQDRKFEDDVFSIIDGVILAGNDIRNLPYSQRIRECEKFSSLATKVFFPKMARITVTKAIELSHLPSLLMKVETSSISALSNSDSWLDTPSSGNPVLSSYVLSVESVFTGGPSITGGKSRGFSPSGILFIETDNPTGTTTIDFGSTLSSRVRWEWVVDMDLPISQTTINPAISNSTNNLHNEEDKERSCPIGSLSARKLVNFICKNIN